MAKESSYRVLGTQAVLGHAPGEIFQAKIDPELEARLLERGSVTRVRQDATKPGTREGSLKSKE